MRTGTDFQWEQFCRLGEMIGDGLHHEEPWISKEYNSLMKILLPETKEEKDYKKKVKSEKNANLDKRIAEKLVTDKCDCGKDLKQSRSGSYVVKCVDPSCNKKFKYKTKKK